MTYQAPHTDIRFILNELAGLAELGQLPGCEDATPELAEAIIDEAGRFASEVLAPLNSVGDREGCRLEDGKVVTPTGWKEAYAQFRDAGWVGLALPTEFGGQGLPRTIAAPVEEIWHSANLAFSLLPGLVAGETEALIAGGDSRLQECYLPKLVSGEWAGTMNLTEPGAGSDLAALRTRAAPQQDGSYRLFGQKIFITFGDHEFTENIVHLVLARIDGAPEGSKGISLFLVPKYLVNEDGSLGARNDVQCIALEHKLGLHGSPTCTMAFGDNGGAVGYLVGQPHRGLESMFIMMNEARFGVGLQGIAMAERAWQPALAYARERVQGRDADSGEPHVPIIRHADVKRMLLAIRARIFASRALAYTAAGWFDRARHHPDGDTADRCRRYVDLLMPVVKGWSTEIGREAIDLALQIHGGMGFVEETGIAQHLRDARVITIYEGTTGIQANDLVGRKILREKGATLRSLLTDMETTQAALAASAAFGDLAEQFRNDIAHVASVLDWILANAPARNNDIYGAAVPFLHLLGTVCGSWQLARAALASENLRSGNAYAPAYLDDVAQVVRFWFAQQAPLAAAYARMVTDGGGAVSAWQAALD
ncbi:acyl-CoA dehydrogenase [Denitratisoma sp. agr-D3]